MRPLRSIVILAVLAALTALPVAAEEAVDEIEEAETCRAVLDAEGEPTEQELCASQAWFTESTGKVGNVEGLSQTEGESTLGFPSWDDSAPTASVTQGAGGGYVGSPVLDIPFEKDPASGVTFEGTLKGNIETLAFELYLFMPEANLPVSSSEHGFRMEILSGRTPVVSHGEAQLVALEPAGNAVFRARFAVTGLYDVAGLRADNDAVRDLRVNVTPFFFGHEAVYVYDSTEVPATMLVNPSAEALTDFAVLPRF